MPMFFDDEKEAFVATLKDAQSTMSVIRTVASDVGEIVRDVRETVKIVKDIVGIFGAFVASRQNSLTQQK